MTLRYLVRAQLDHGVVRAWTGTGDLTIDEPIALDGKVPGAEGVYRAGAALIGTRNNSVAFGFRGKAMVGTPVGGRTVDVFLVAETDEGEHHLLPTTHRGILSAPTIEQGTYTVSIVPRVYAAPAQQWSQEEQTRLHANDFFFSQMRALAKGIQGIHFPDVPNFREDGDYDRRAVNKPSGDTGRGSPQAGLRAPTTSRAPGIVLLGGQSAVRLTQAPSGVPRGV